MTYDCAIVGGGPAGLNAALVLGRARRKVILLDNNQPRNAVTHESHGFITRDGVKPAEFRRIAYEEVLRYPSVEHQEVEVTRIEQDGNHFRIETASGQRIQARKLILSSGLKEVLPEIEGAREFYGTSLFNCPFCDGWELRDQPLVAVSEYKDLFHKAKLLLNWSRDLVLCTNGKGTITDEERQQLAKRNIPIIDKPIASFAGRDGQLEEVIFADGSRIARSGGFLSPAQVPNLALHEALGCEKNQLDGLVVDEMGRTSVPGVYAAGDAAYVMPAQLIFAAASGSRAGIGVHADMTEEDWHARPEEA
ncbi:NAD(P)/FAD-dependent oxidoreductase [Paenibacillus daejeonensis]|uniref:NAD(P)/FAD-dependent oxidoreductase n=1 Tax=Paenibacillus daejeonensis TaxID=135193 RepID=UPI00035C5B4A|nr:NAD(P)/FAD-dependent oxidoreductase [Paenibacillus daejeonensis]